MVLYYMSSFWAVYVSFEVENHECGDLIKQNDVYFPFECFSKYIKTNYINGVDNRINQLTYWQKSFHYTYTVIKRLIVLNIMISKSV